MNDYVEDEVPPPVNIQGEEDPDILPDDLFEGLGGGPPDSEDAMSLRSQSLVSQLSRVTRSKQTADLFGSQAGRPITPGVQGSDRGLDSAQMPRRRKKEDVLTVTERMLSG